MSSLPASKRLRYGRQSLANHCYLITSTTWQRRPAFADFGASCRVAASFAAAATPAADLLCWVLMPDHAHWVLRLTAQGQLADVVRRIKARSAHAYNQFPLRAGALWQPGYHDVLVRDESKLRAICRYVVTNPLRAGLAENIGQYPFWNAVWLDCPIAAKAAPT